MRHFLTSFIVVFVSYSLGLSTPAAGARSRNIDYNSVKSYVNSPGKKNIRTFVTKMEQGIPSEVYENAIKETKGQNGKIWFDAAKIGDNYGYFRLGSSKMFTRTSVKNGKVVFYVNGVEIQEKEFNNLRALKTKLFFAYLMGLKNRKVSFLDFFSHHAYAGSGGVVNPETATSNINIGGSSPRADDIATEPSESCIQALDRMDNMNDKEIKNGVKDARVVCANQPIFKNNTDDEIVDNVKLYKKENPEKKDKKWLWILLGVGALIFLLFMLKKKKEKKKEDPKNPGETPEDENPVGRGDDFPVPPVCNGVGAQCGDEQPVDNPGVVPVTTPYEEPDTPVVPTSPNDDPNEYDTPTGRSTNSFKLDKRAKVKTNK